MISKNLGLFFALLFIVTFENYAIAQQNPNESDLLRGDLQKSFVIGIRPDNWSDASQFLAFLRSLALQNVRIWGADGDCRINFSLQNISPGGSIEEEINGELVQVEVATINVNFELIEELASCNLLSVKNVLRLRGQELVKHSGVDSARIEIDNSTLSGYEWYK